MCRVLLPSTAWIVSHADFQSTSTVQHRFPKIEYIAVILGNKSVNYIISSLLLTDFSKIIICGLWFESDGCQFFHHVILAHQTALSAMMLLLHHFCFKWRVKYWSQGHKALIWIIIRVIRSSFSRDPLKCWRGDVDRGNGKGDHIFDSRVLPCILEAGLCDSAPHLAAFEQNLT
jgi:hypothetical protein